MPAQDRFSICLAETLDQEGGYSNDPHDPGGPTMRGVIQTEYDAWRERQHLPKQSVRLITDAEFRAIYRANYWDIVQADKLPAGLDLEVFDFAVNSGPPRAVRCLQGCLGLVQDGHMGAITIDAANRADLRELIPAYMRARLKFWRALATYWRFGRGWEKRGREIQAAALAMEAGSHAPAVADKPAAISADAQAATQAKAVSESKPVSATTAGTVAAAMGAGAVGAVQGAQQTIAPPPQPLVDSVANIGLWQTIGQQLGSFGRFVVNNPVEVGAIVVLVMAVWYAPRLLPLIWRRQQ